ncbi:hypothetical protein MHU86_6142 [Fragilaria crotonensis]|nr:hypothetical protein MHU86_6142 [Fragilaria crotonensis]
MKSSAAILCLLPAVSGFAFVHRSSSAIPSAANGFQQQVTPRKSTAMKMLDQNVIQGIGVGVFGLAFGIGLVAFTEKQGERAKERGGGLSENMATKIAGMLLEDVEVSSVSDLGSLTSQLEKALKETGGAKEEDLEMSEEDKKRIAEEAEDGW